MCYARRFEGGHLVANVDGGVDESDRDGRASALAEPQVEIEERAEAELIEDDCVPGFDRPMQPR
jgi:hypothetical protein